MGPIEKYRRRCSTSGSFLAACNFQSKPPASAPPRRNSAAETRPAAASVAPTERPQLETEVFEIEGVSVMLRRNPDTEVVAVQAYLGGGLAYAGPKRAGVELLMLQIAEKQSAGDLVLRSPC